LSYCFRGSLFPAFFLSFSRKIRAGLYPQVTEFVSRASLGRCLACGLTLKFSVLSFDVSQRLQDAAIWLVL